MALIVQKYGGSSLATPEYIKRVAGQIVKEKQQGNRIVVVVSALGDTTDYLIQMAYEICDQPPEREMDMLLSVGERTSIALLAMAIQNLGVDAISFTGSQVGIITDTKHTEARILEVRANRLLSEVNKGKIVIVAGFQGVSVTREITTLGRGGSDTTAIALAAALKADRCEIMKDVDGVYLAEPKLIPEVSLNKQISYDEMIEMANLGAGVLKTESIEIAKVHKIKIAVGSSFTGKIGTIITDRSLDSSGISGIVGQKDLVLVTVNSHSADLFRLFDIKIAENDIKTKLFFAKSNERYLLIQEENMEKIEKILSGLKCDDRSSHYSLQADQGIVAIVGTGLNFGSESARSIFPVLEKLKIDCGLMQVSQLRICWTMPAEEIDNSIRDIYKNLDKIHIH